MTLFTALSLALAAAATALALVLFAWLQKARWSLGQQLAAGEHQRRQRLEFLERLDSEARARTRRLQNLLTEQSTLALTPQQKRHLLSIRRQADENSRFLSDLIQFDQLSIGSFRDVDETFDLESLATEVVRSFASSLRYEDVEIVIQVRDSANALFTGQKRQVSTLLAHLVENAISNLHKGEVTLSFVGRSAGAGSREITMAVADNGPGIGKDTLTHVFDPFSQQESLSGKKTVGSGLGLAIARLCARSLQGELAAVSLESQGTTFTARVTLTEASGPQPDTPVPSQTLRDQCSRVLVVDDSHSNARFLREIFECWNIPVSAFTSARDCLQSLRAAENSETPPHYDLLLLDDSIEDFDYVSLMHYLQNHRSFVRKVVLMAPLTEVSSSSARMREPGIDGHILKPIRRRELLRVLEFAGSLPPEPVPAPRPAPRAPAAVSGRVRCLVVEDNLVNMHTVTELLRLKNYEFLVAENGKEALAVYRQNAAEIDVILMDVQMPEMDGFEATRRIRQFEEGGTRTPIIALTAFSLEEEREKCLEAGMDDFLAKPIHVDVLFEKIEYWLHSSNRERSGRGEKRETPSLQC